MKGFRKIEAVLTEFFRREGNAPTSAGGDVFLGTHETRRYYEEIVDGESRASVRVDKRFGAPKIVSLTELAKLLERELS